MRDNTKYKYIYIYMSFQGGVNHFEDGPETPMEVKIFQVNPKTRGRLVGA